MVTRRKFGREFKLEAVNLVTVRGVALAQAARDLDVNESVLRRWVKESALDPAHAFPGGGNMKPELAEIAQLKKEVAKLRMERDLLKKAATGSTDHCNTNVRIQLICWSHKIQCFLGR
jgi:transposase